ncbi:MAG: hypothetical protein HY549_05705, partial [Elusimicrobia bacterium]|nr:hypothetical protein [Elusimicrobiota bacterium]
MDLRRRLALAASACLLPLLPLTMRLGRLQIMEHPDWNSKAASELDRSSQEVALRAEILDREGKVLAQSAPMWRCFIDKRMVRDVNGLAARLSPYLGMPAAEIARQVNAARRIATLKTRLDYERMTALNQARIEGVGVIAGQERFYPNGDLGRGILGEVSSEGKGLAGLELALEQKLAGRSRKFRVIRDGAGKSIYKSAEEEGEAPEPVVLTIDRNVQYYAEEILGETARQSSMKRGMILVQDPSNGEILAMAAYPSNSLHNPIVQDSFEPGSTF